MNTSPHKTAALWSGVLLLVGLIYTTIPLISALRDTADSRFGPRFFPVLFVVIGGCVFALLSLWLFFTTRPPLVKSAGVLLIFVLIYGYLFSTITYPIERIHFVEYGALGALAYLALCCHGPSAAATVGAVLIATLVGLGDEAIQSVLVDRVGEIRDVGINVVSALAAVLYTGFFSFNHKKWTARDSTMVCFLASACCIGVMIFIPTVHGFGMVVENCSSGRFFTALNPDLLRSKGYPENRRERKIYINEAKRHLFLRDYYLTKEYAIAGSDNTYRDFWSAAGENTILEGYYAAWLADRAGTSSNKIVHTIDEETARRIHDSVTVRWSTPLSSAIYTRAGTTARLYVSRVKSTLVTGCTQNDFFFYTTALLLIILLIWKRLLTHTGPHAPATE